MTIKEELHQRTLQLDLQLGMLERIIRSRNPLEAVEAERIRVSEEISIHADKLLNTERQVPQGNFTDIH